MEIYAQEPFPYVPDNITVPQFIFDTLHKARPPRRNGMPWLIQDETGQKLGEAEVRAQLLQIHTSHMSPSSCATVRMDSQMDLKRSITSV